MPRFTAETAKQFGSRGGRRSRRGKLTQSVDSLRDFSTLVLTDLEVQRKLIEQARAGELPSAVLNLLAGHFAGKVPQRIEVTRPNATGDELRERIRALTPQERGRYGDALRIVAAVQEGRPLPPLDVTPRPRALTGRPEAIARDDDWRGGASAPSDADVLARIDEMNKPVTEELLQRADDLPLDALPAMSRRAQRRAAPGEAGA